MFQPCPKCGRLKNPRSKTCSLCATKGRKKKPADAVTLICKNCTEPFQLPRWRVNQGRGSFCSRKCKDEFLKTIRGKDHHKYTGGRLGPAKYVGTNWQEARKAILARANGKCEKCGRDLSTVKHYVVHHIIGVYKFTNMDDAHTPDNLSAICQSCHAKIHRLGKMPIVEGGDSNRWGNDLEKLL